MATFVETYRAVISRRVSPTELAPFLETIPVGGVFIGTTDTNPASLLGYGTWELHGSGYLRV
jgi:hypothetical protein